MQAYFANPKKAKDTLLTAIPFPVMLNKERKALKLVYHAQSKNYIIYFNCAYTNPNYTETPANGRLATISRAYLYHEQHPLVGLLTRIIGARTNDSCCTSPVACMEGPSILVLPVGRSG
jgi:hypothetical protein